MLAFAQKKYGINETPQYKSEKLPTYKNKLLQKIISVTFIWSHIDHIVLPLVP